MKLRLRTVVGPACVVAGACGGEGLAGPGPELPGGELTCSLDERFLASTGVGRDGIPSLDDPRMVGREEVEYLQPTDRVIGLFLAGVPIAVPHNVLWWHEVVNLTGGGQHVAVTYCPLTGTALVFDRAAVGGAPLGVSGLLFQSNLIMYDRSADPSFWPQMLGEARCGPREGSGLTRLPAIETTWRAWSAAHPGTQVPADPGDILRDFTVYPYGDYESADSDYLYPMPAGDSRYPAKERVLGLPDETGGRAFPFSELARAGTLAVVPAALGAEPVIVLWDQDEASANAFHPEAGDGSPLTLSVQPGGIIDLETGSRWRPDGVAIAGPLVGHRLRPVAEAYVAFWGAWTAFFPATGVWQAP